MRSRLLTLMLIAILTMSFAACSKKDQSQNTAAPATDTSTAAQSNPSATPSQPASSQPATSQMAPAQQSPQGSNRWRPRAAQQRPQAPEPPPPPPPLVIPAGTSLVVRMGNSITSKTANPGDTFTGSLAHAVAVDGVVAIPAGAGVSGTVVDAKSPGKIQRRGCIVDRLDRCQRRRSASAHPDFHLYQDGKG